MKIEAPDIGVFNTTAFTQAFMESIAPDPDLLIADWAEKYFYLPESVKEPGLIRLKDRTPYLIEPLNRMTPGSDAQDVSFMGGSQLAKTTLLVMVICYLMAMAPKGYVVYEPTGELIDAFVKGKLNPSIESSPVLKALFQNPNDDTLGEKIYKGCTGYFRAAKSKNAFSSISVPYVLSDETDRWDRDIGGEGSPKILAKGRRKTFGINGKSLNISTPTIKDFSPIEEDYLKGDQRRYNIPCPHCKSKQILLWSHIHYLKDPETDNKTCIKDSVYYECQICKYKIKEYEKSAMLSEGEWIPENPKAPKGYYSYQLSALYSPIGMYHWHEIIDKRLDAGNDLEKLKAWTNTDLGECWFENSDQPNYKLLEERAEPYPLYTVNKKAVIIYGGGDVQNNRVVLKFWAFGEEEEMWQVAYEEILGSPASPETWERVNQLARRGFKHEMGFDMYCKGIAIDTMGTHTAYVYDFCNKNSDLFYAVRGSPHDNVIGYMSQGKSVEQDLITGKRFATPLKFYLMNTTEIKKTIYSYINNMIANEMMNGARVVHFSRDTQTPVFKMLVSERHIRKIKNGQMVDRFEKVKEGDANEALDCTVYCCGLAWTMGVRNLYGKQYQEVYKINVLEKVAYMEKKANPEVPAKQLIKPKKKAFINNNGYWK